MSTNSEEIVQQIRTEVEALFTFILSTSPSEALTAYDMERSLLQRLRSLGQMLLQLYFQIQSQRFTAPTFRTAQGENVPFHSHKVRSYLSVFGKISLRRAYYYDEQTKSGVFPTDAALNLPQKGGSDLLRQWREQLGAYDAYHRVGPTMKSLLGPQPISSRQLHQQIAEDANLVEAFYDQAPPPLPISDASILVVQADGKGVPMRASLPSPSRVRLGKGQKKGRKKEAIVTSVYTLAPWIRTPKEVTASFFAEATRSQEKSAAPKQGPCNKRYWATLEGKDAALRFTARHLVQQESEHVVHRVALTDGSEALQQRVRKQFPQFSLVLDFIHANEYLWEVANALLGETNSARQDWVSTHTLQMLCGQTAELTAVFRRMAAEPGCKKRLRTTLLKVASYYERNLKYMRYDRYLAAGWPIATGVIEGACRHLVKDRCELSGMRWSQVGAEALLRIRCVAENGDWEAFHAFRRQRRPSDLYKQVPVSGGTFQQKVGLANHVQATCLAA